MEDLISEFKHNSVQMIFEGIETEDQLNFVKSLGCRIVQGYYYSKPLPLSEFEEKYLDSPKVEIRKRERGLFIPRSLFLISYFTDLKLLQ